MAVNTYIYRFWFPNTVNQKESKTLLEIIDSRAGAVKLPDGARTFCTVKEVFKKG